VLAALDTYRKTSPEMVVFGRMIGDSFASAPQERPLRASSDSDRIGIDCI
jgi:hypothetical protein